MLATFKQQNHTHRLQLCGDLKEFILHLQTHFFTLQHNHKKFSPVRSLVKERQCVWMCVPSWPGGLCPRCSETGAG